jgi:hypothetical protein
MKSLQKPNVVIELSPELETKFEMLKRKLGVDLELEWIPNTKKLSQGVKGEVVGTRVMVYELTEEEALRTLKHELVDYLISNKLVKPLVELLNQFIRMREAEIYRQKEEITEALSELLL